MKRGILVGEVWASRKVEQLVGRSLKLVVETASADADAALYAPLTVAIDTIGGGTSQPGQKVLLAFGSGARNVIEPGPHNRAVLADAAIAPPAAPEETTLARRPAFTRRPAPACRLLRPHRHAAHDPAVGGAGRPGAAAAPFCRPGPSVALCRPA